jgi:hypothetical protein
MSLTQSNLAIEVLEKAPNLYPYLNRTGFVFVPLGGHVHYMLIIVLLSNATAIIISSSMLVIIGVTLRKRYKAQSFSKTLKLQFALFKALLLETIIAHLFLVVPLDILVISLLLGLNGNTATYFLCMSVSIHAFLEYLSQIYFISPYRKFVKSLLKRLKEHIGGFFGLNTSQQPIVITIQNRQAFKQNIATRVNISSSFVN